MAKEKTVAAAETAQTVEADEGLTALETDALAQAQSFFEKGVATDIYPDPEKKPEPKAEPEAREAEGTENTDESTTTETVPEKEPAKDDEDESLEELSKLSDEELDTLGKEKAWDDSYVRRVKKFTRQLRETQERAASTQAELESIKSTRTPITQDASPLGNIETADQLEAEKAKVEDALSGVERLRRRARRDPEGVARTLIENKVSVADGSIEAVEEALDSVEDGCNTLLRKAFPARGRFLAEVHRNVGQALTEFPELQDSKNKLTIAANEELRRAPHLRKSSDWPLVALNLALGRMKSDELKLAKIKKPETTAKPTPPKIPSVTKSAPAKPAKNGAGDAARTKALSTGKESDVAEFIKSQLT